MVYGFVHTDSEPEIQAVADDLPPLVKKNLQDIEGGYRVDSLRKSHLEAAGVNPGEVDEIVGAMGRIEYTNDLPDVLDAISTKRKDWVAENTTYYNVLEDTDRDCFLAKDCLTYSVTAEQISEQKLIGTLTQTFSQEFIWVEHDGHDAVASRVLAPDPVDVSSAVVAIDQQYSFFLIRQLPKGGCERVESMWAEARALSFDVPDSFAVDTAVSSMGKQAERVDAWIDAGKPKGEGF